jgi:protein-S-isoprenylcysteine O-methyltransferase Ste14
MRSWIAALWTTLALLALGVFIGGIIALGALAAPVVFGIVPAPFSADAMTIVFRRFDRVAIACVIIVLIAEAMLALRSSSRIARARPILAIALAAFVLYVAFAVSPKIEALHHAGAIRGLGPDGLALDSIHSVAEALGKIELAIAVVLILLHAIVLTASSPDRR